MKLTRIKIKNIKSLESLDMTLPDSPLIYIVGTNGSGKTAFLDSIAMALQGKRKISKGSIRNGESTALIELELDNGMKVRRKITGSGAYLSVFQSDGQEISSPQKYLDPLLGPISLDPWPFIQGTAKGRRDLILASAGIADELTQLDASDTKTRDDRRLAKRMLKETGTILASKPPIDPGTSDQLVDLKELREKLEEGAEFNRVLTRAADKIVSGAERVQEIEEEVARLNGKAQTIRDDMKKIETWKGDKLPVVLDVLKYNIDKGEEVNRLIGEHTETRLLLEQEKKQIDQVAMLETQVAKIEGKRGKLMAKIAGALPVEGLTVNSEDVLVNDVRFPDLSTAERLRVAIALATAESPELRIIRITDGSVLDADSRKYLDKVASENEFQILIEDVRETGISGIKLSTEDN